MIKTNEITIKPSFRGEYRLRNIIRAGDFGPLLELLNEPTQLLVPINDYGHTLLHAVIASNSAAAIRLLYDNSIGLDRKLPDGMLPLHIAIQWRADAALQEMLVLGVDAEQQNTRGNVAIHEAVLANWGQGLFLLLEAGACVDAQNLNHRTALGLALEYDKKLPNGISSIFKVLIRYGADTLDLPRQFSVMPHHSETLISRYLKLHNAQSNFVMNSVITLLETTPLPLEIIYEILMCNHPPSIVNKACKIIEKLAEGSKKPASKPCYWHPWTLQAAQWLPTFNKINPLRLFLSPEAQSSRKSPSIT